MDQVYPTEEEQHGYYSGLLSRPRLLARSSTQPWLEMHGGIPRRQTDTGNEPIYCRQLSPPGAHPIADLWHDPQGPLRLGLLHALQSVPWSAIDWCRVGVHIQHALTSTFELTMMVSVPPNLVSLSDASEAADRCKAIMESCGFMDIHCEIRESSISLLVDDTTTSQATTQAMELIHKVPTDRVPDAKHFHSMVGTEIAMLARPTVTASKGLYIRGDYLGQQYTAALTCRHLLTSHQDDNIDLEPMKTGKTVGNGELSVIQWGDEKLQSRRDCNEGFRSWLEEDQRPDYQLEPPQIELKQKYRKMYEDEASRIARLYNAHDRVFGTILVSPSIGLSPRGPGVTNQWLMDWMLIQLDARRHEEKLSQLDNALFLSMSQIETAALQAQTELFSCRLHRQGQQHGSDPNRILLPLRGLMSIDEMRYPAGQTEYHDEPATLVGKLGPKSGLTCGYASTFKSVIRTPINGCTIEAEVWPVITPRDCVFSRPGDSGSCVWALDGRIAGIVVAGLGKLSPQNTACADVTYVLPMEAILEDMKRWGFQGVV